MSKAVKISIVIIITLIYFSSVYSFESDRSDGTFEPPEDPEIQCWNGEDDSDDGYAPPPEFELDYYEDPPGCVNPYWEDTNEGFIWDSHLMAEIDNLNYDSVWSEASTSPSVDNMAFYFAGNVFRNGKEDEWSDSSADSTITVHWVDAVRGEDDDAFAFGFPRSDTFDEDDFVTGSKIAEDRVIDPPHNYGDAEMCGNGKEQLDQSKTGDDENIETSTTECREDYGRIQEKYDASGSFGRESPYNYKGSSGMTCRDDDVTCSGRDCGMCGSSCGQGSCDGTYYGEDEGNQFWDIDGEDIYTEECDNWADDCTDCIDSLSGCSLNTGCCSSYSCDRYGNSCCSSGDSCNFNSISDGDERSWQEQNRRDCRDYNVVDGGGDNSGDDQPKQWGDNDASGTFTKFTPYSEDGGSANTGNVWCGYDYTLTVNADGPNGNGDGFIVIDERSGDGIDSVVARESPDGSSRVGRNVHYGEDGDVSRTDTDFIDSVGLDLSCSGRTAVCLKYVDFYTIPGTNDKSLGPVWSNVDEAVDAEEVFEFTPGESYSVCKAVNRINEEHGDSRGENLIDCDYMRDGENISPLSEACGDEHNENLMVMEGSSVDSNTAENWLGHEQECVSWGDGEVDNNGRELDRSACVNQGEAWAEGTVMNVASENFVNDDYPDRGYPYTEEGWEEGVDSPDWQVCLDIDDYVEEDAPKPYNHRHNDPDNDHYGGQWYDLDDERINDYLRSNEDNLPESIDSSTAGEDSQEIDYIDFYYTENRNPQHPDYNPKGGMEGTALISNCGPGINCGDDADNVRGTDSGNFFAFSNRTDNTFARWSRDEDYNPQGRWSRNYNEELDLDYSITSDRPEDSRQEYDASFIEPRDDFIGYLVEARSASDQLGDDHPDRDNYNNLDWWYDTYVNEDRAVQFAYAEGPDWGVDSTGVAYPPGGQSYSTGYVVSGDAEAGNFRHIDADNSPRTGIEDDSISKTDKAHGNSILVVASEDNSHNFKEGQAYWIDPDDITREWHLDNIDRAYW